MTEEKAPAPEAPKPPSRRRASRASGPAGGPTGETSTAVRVQAPGTVRVRPARPAGPPPRRPANRRLVGIVSLSVGVVAAAALAAVVVGLLLQQRSAEATEARDQRFVDTATQTVQNMFSYTQDNIDESVNRFVDGTSGPLRDMLSQNNNVENLKALFRDTNASSEAVINGAALENVDNLANRASVLVSVRVTVTDIEGINKPSQPYRLRLTVNEDDNGHMTAYDLQYPEGGN
jgi:Mce-associated membrane protein